MLIHLLAYMLYLASLIYYFVDIIIKNEINDPHAYEVSETIKLALNSLSLVALSYVFWIIGKTSER